MIYSNFIMLCYVMFQLIYWIDQLMVYLYYMTIVKIHEIHFFPTAILGKEPQV